MIKAIMTAAFLAMGILMMFFALAGLQTIEECKNQGMPVPWQAWAMLVTVVVWCVIAANLPDKCLKDMDRFLAKLTEE